MSYSKTNWTPTTPINPSNLNKMEEGIRQNAADIENLNSNLEILNIKATDIDFTIVSGYSSVIAKQENYSYRTGNVVTLNISVKFSGSISSYDPILTIQPAPRRITYCRLQSVNDGTLIPAFIESSGSLKVRLSKTLSGFHEISATYTI